MQYAILAASMTDTSEPGEAALFYKKAIKISPTERNRAFNRRLYGRALILAGQYETGRSEMISAADAIAKLSSTAGYNSEAMKTTRADVYIRLIWAEINMGWTTYVKDDFATLKMLSADVLDSGRRSTLQNGIDELNTKIQSLQLQPAALQKIS